MPGKAQYHDTNGSLRNNLPFGAGGGEAAGGCWAGGRGSAEAPHGTLSVSDIAGAQPTRRIRPPRDVQQAAPLDPGMHPQRFTRKRRQPCDMQLTVSDIPGATAGGHSDWLRPRAQPSNPLVPQYQWSMSGGQEPAPPPKFLRDTLDVSDIQGAKADSVPRRPARGASSTMNAGDIDGTQPGWRPHNLFAAGQTRDTLRVADISAARPSARQKHQQLVGDSGSSLQEGRPWGASGPAPPACGAWFQQAQAGSFQQGQQHQHQHHQPDYGVAYTADRHRQRLGAIVQQGGSARQARQAAEAAITAAAATAAAAAAAKSSEASPAGGGSLGGQGPAPVGLAGLMRTLKVQDREKSGRVQAGEFATALHSSGLGLTHGEVQQLVSSMRDSHNGVEYRPFMSKMWGKMQEAAGEQRQASGCGGGNSGVSHGGSMATAAASDTQAHMPQFVAARQRRLQTNVALALNQQPEALAHEAAEVAMRPGFLPWREPASKQFGKRMDYVHHEEHPTHHSFGGSDPKAAEAAEQWKASNSAMAAWQMRRENRPSKQDAARDGSSSLPASRPVSGVPAGQQEQHTHLPPAGGRTARQLTADAGSRRRVEAGCVQQGGTEGSAAGNRRPCSGPAASGTAATTRSYMRLPAGSRGTASHQLAAERAARSAGQDDVALVRSLD